MSIAITKSQEVVKSSEDNASVKNDWMKITLIFFSFIVMPFLLYAVNSLSNRLGEVNDRMFMMSQEMVKLGAEINMLRVDMETKSANHQNGLDDLTVTVEQQMKIASHNLSEHIYKDLLLKDLDDKVNSLYLNDKLIVDLIKNKVSNGFKFDGNDELNQDKSVDVKFKKVFNPQETLICS